MNLRDASCVVVGLVWLATASTASAADFYVSAAAAAGGSGSKGSPFRTVQAAIDASASGDTIRVAAGEYVENLRVDGKDIVLEGGYDAAFVRDIARNTTTLKGAGGDSVINLLAADATVDGFRITGGEGSTEEAPFGYHGGGIYSRDGSPTITNNTIEENDVRRAGLPSDYHFGGGVHITSAPNATITKNVIRRNYAGRGAGLSVGGEAALIKGNTIDRNVAIGDHGGGMFIAVVDATITENIIRRNEVGRALGYGWGGGLIVVGQGNSAELSFNVLYENYAAAYGAAEFIDEGARAEIHHELIYRNVSKDGCEAVSAIAVDGGEGVGSRATISHCTVVNNVCESAIRGNGLQVEGLSIVSVVNCIFWNNGGDDFATDNTSTLTVTYTNSQEAIAGAGNISVDPKFVDEATNDYHLAAGSPCIDAGDPTSPFDKEAPVSGGRADMGRYGNAPASGSAGRDDDDDDDNNNGNDNDNGNNNGNDNDNGDDDNAGSPASPIFCGTMSPAMMSACIGMMIIGRRRVTRGRWARYGAC